MKGFELKRIRSGIETLLVAQGVSREIRGHLQSHGLTGVQARYYDGLTTCTCPRNAWRSRSFNASFNGNLPRSPIEVGHVAARRT